MRGARNFLRDFPGCPRPLTRASSPSARPGGDSGLRRPADRRLRADPVHAPDRDGARDPTAVRATDDQQVLRARPRTRAEHDRVARWPGPAGVRDLLAQPRRRTGPLRPGHLCDAVLEARGAVAPITGQPTVHLNGACSGGIISAGVVGHLAAQGRLTPASLTLLVAALDNERAGTAAALVGRETAAAAVADSARRGYLDGQALSGVFTWLRPNDLVWNYVVNNYLLGKDPPASRCSVLEPGHGPARRRSAPRFHPPRAGQLPGHRPGALEVLGTPFDLGAVDPRQLHRRGVDRSHHPVGERVPQHAAARRRAALRALDQRPHPGVGQPAVRREPLELPSR